MQNNVNKSGVYIIRPHSLPNPTFGDSKFNVQ
jgi:hypothetical protein